MTALHLNELSNQTWKLFLTTHVMVIEQIERDLAAANLPPLSWYGVLWTLEKAPDHEMRLHELAEQVLLSRSNITRLIDRLEEAELLCRKRCPRDRRGAYAVLTEAGLAMRQQMWAIYSQGIARYFAKQLNAEEMNTLNQAFQQILAAVKETPVAALGE